ncbi:MAG TPA: hypothetical protein PK295_04715, partial [Candidatus Magasanikbacteria bacterium]|nr:hypothetical protein [Candidatus Magasanikbacteria bacterium]
STRPNSVEFNVISVSWKRIDPHYIADASEYINDRINVTIDNFKYVSGSTSNGQNGPMVEFLVTNHSLFDFWEFSGMLEFTRDGQIIGYSPLVIPQFKGGETRVVSLGILSSISLIHSVELIPSVNVFDPNVFMIQ